MSFKYTGKTPVKAGDKVLIQVGEDDDWVDAKVIDPLASQFTARQLYRKTTGFYSYTDKGVTWKLQ